MIEDPEELGSPAPDPPASPQPDHPIYYLGCEASYVLLERARENVSSAWDYSSEAIRKLISDWLEEQTCWQLDVAEAAFLGLD